MLKRFLNSEGVKALSKTEQKSIIGGTCSGPSGTEGIDYSYAPYFICDPESVGCDTSTCSFINIYGELVYGKRLRVGTECDVCKLPNPSPF